VTKDSNHVSIAALQGLVDVRNGAGVLVATVRPGLALAFTTQAGGASTATQMKGCLVKKGDKYFMTDDTTGVTVELQGPGVAGDAGHQVNITGSMIPGATPAAGASQVVQVVTVDSVGAKCGGPAGAAVGGVVVGGTLIGLAASGAFSGSSTPASNP
jgi:hypothetical protein